VPSLSDLLETAGKLAKRLAGFRELLNCDSQ
jgi:hypothetical protein